MADRDLIDAIDFEMAEGKLVASSRIGMTNNIHLKSARVDEEAWIAFISHHASRLYKDYLPAIDPRDESSINTMLRHFFLVGVHAERQRAARS